MQVTNLEKRLALVEGREAAVVSQLRTAEAAAAEGESAAAENASLREQLRELKRDRSQLEQHKMVGLAGTQRGFGRPFHLTGAICWPACGMHGIVGICALCLSAQSLLSSGPLHFRATAASALEGASQERSITPR